MCQGPDHWRDLRASGRGLRRQRVEETISKITDAVVGEMSEWLHRPLDAEYASVFIDAIAVKIRDGHVTNRPVYTAIGVTVEGQRDILGLWVGVGGEGAKFWLQVLNGDQEPRHQRRVHRRLRRLSGLPDAVAATWPLAVVQTCVLHLIRNTSSSPHGATGTPWRVICGPCTPCRPSRPPRNASGSSTRSGRTYPAIIQLWNNAWTEFAPFLDYSPEIRRVIYSTNAIESLHARFRRATRARGHFPNEQAALKCLYPVVRSLEPHGRGRHRWKPALNAFAITFRRPHLPRHNHMTPTSLTPNFRVL